MAKKLDIFIIVYLDDIFIYSKNPSQFHIDAIWWVLEHLRKNGFFANLKKCHFHQNKVRFLEYIVSTQKIQMQDHKIEAVKN